MEPTDKQKHDFDSLVEAAQNDALLLVMVKRKDGTNYVPVICIDMEHQDGTTTLYPLAVLGADWSEYEPPTGMLHLKPTRENHRAN